MAEQSSPSFEHQVLEADIKRLAVEVQKHQEKPEAHRFNDQEILKKSIQSIGGVQPASSLQAQPSGNPLPDYAKDAPAETKLEIEYLLDMAFHHCIEKANGEAKKSSPFVMDAFHDALVTKLYPELQKRGIVK